MLPPLCSSHGTAATETYPLSLHDALPISLPAQQIPAPLRGDGHSARGANHAAPRCGHRSEEHTSELQSRVDLVCRLLLEKKKEPDRRSSAGMRKRRTRGADAGAPSSRTPM